MGVFINIVAWTTFVFWQIYTPKKKDTKWYKDYIPHIAGAPPAWLFGIAWTVLYALMVATAVTFFGDVDTYVAAFVVFVVNVLLNKFWTPTFFRERRMGASVAIALGMLGTEIALLIVFGVEQAWLQFGLYLPYAVWTAYAVYLNIRMTQLAKEGSRYLGEGLLR